MIIIVGNGSPWAESASRSRQRRLASAGSAVPLLGKSGGPPPARHHSTNVAAHSSLTESLHSCMSALSPLSTVQVSRARTLSQRTRTRPLAFTFAIFIVFLLLCVLRCGWGEARCGTERLVGQSPTLPPHATQHHTLYHTVAKLPTKAEHHPTPLRASPCFYVVFFVWFCDFCSVVGW